MENEINHFDRLGAEKWKRDALRRGKEKILSFTGRKSSFSANEIYILAFFG